MSCVRLLLVCSVNVLCFYSGMLCFVEWMNGVIVLNLISV